MKNHYLYAIMGYTQKDGGAQVNKNSKIGIFDSGLGGLSVLNTIRGLLPNESYIYIGDSKNAPYGTKTKEQVFELSKAICDTLIEKDVKAIVIACNTATSAAINKLRDIYDIPIIGMEPAIKPALKQSIGKVAVLATEMTLKEEKFQKLVESLEDGYRIIKLPAPDWVECVENHLNDSEYVKSSVTTLLEANIPSTHSLVLGCTHFIFLKDYIRDYYHNDVEIFDGNIGTALQLRNTLESQGLLIEEESISFGSEVTNAVEIYNTKSDEYVTKSYELLSMLRKGI